MVREQKERERGTIQRLLCLKLRTDVKGDMILTVTYYLPALMSSSLGEFVWWESTWRRPGWM